MTLDIFAIPRQRRLVASRRAEVAQAASWCRWHGPEAKPLYQQRRAALREALDTLAALEAAVAEVPEVQSIDLHRFPHLDNAFVVPSDVETPAPVSPPAIEYLVDDIVTTPTLPRLLSAAVDTALTILAASPFLLFLPV
jgi:hypothetical protein